MNSVNIGEKLKSIRIEQGLTQEELAGRCELSKGFISQLERDLTSPSIATLVDILECLGTNLNEFFGSKVEQKIVIKKEDVFEQENVKLGNSIDWLVPHSVRCDMQPIMVTLESNGRTEELKPYEGEEFGYVLRGTIVLHLGGKKHRVKKGESFYFRADSSHYLENTRSTPAQVLWVTTPPNF